MSDDFRIKVWLFPLRDGNWYWIDKHEPKPFPGGYHAPTAWGPYKAIGHAKGSIRRHWRNKKPEQFNMVILPAPPGLITARD